MSRIINDSEKDTITVNSLQVKTETVTGSSTVKGNETIGGDLTVQNAASVGTILSCGGVNSNGDAIVTGNTYLNGTARVLTNLTVNGTATVVGTLSANGVNSNGDAVVAGSAYLTGPGNFYSQGIQYVKDQSYNYILARAYRNPTFVTPVAGVMSCQLIYNLGTNYADNGGVYAVTVSPNVPDYDVAYGFFYGIVQFSNFSGGKATVNGLVARNIDGPSVAITSTGLLTFNLTGGAFQTGQYRVSQVQIGY